MFQFRRRGAIADLFVGGARKRDLNNLYQVIYYGDSQVEVGKPFSISCIISIANAVEWHKDGEPIRKHSNIRHGKDEHSYIESEMGIAGNRDKIEASISVQRALPKHQGKYQCNALYRNYHQLYVYRNGTPLGHSQPSPGRGSERRHDADVSLPVVLDTTKSTLLAPVAIDHHHFTTAVALAPAPVELDREEEGTPPKPSSGHGSHHHRPQTNGGDSSGAGAAGGHRHRSNGVTAGEKQQQQQHAGPGKDDSKRFVSQKTTIEQKQREVEEAMESLLPLTHGDKTTASGKTKHTPTARLQPPPPLLEAAEEDEDDGADVDDDAIDVDEEEPEEEEEVVVGPDGRVIEGLVEPDTEIIIESKAVSLEDDNIERLIQNKSDINGIILVDSLEELPAAAGATRTHAKSHNHGPPEDHTSPGDTLNTALAVVVSTGVPIRISSSFSEGQEMIHPPSPPISATTTSTPAPTTTTTALTTTTSTETAAHATFPAAAVGEQNNSDSTGHHHHHHHHEHHTTTAATTTITSTTTTAAAADVLQPNYDVPSTSLKIFDIGKALTLGCNVTKDGEYELSWEKNGTNVSLLPELKDRFKILSAERKFIISRALDTDAGQYTCSVSELKVSKAFNVVANVVVKFESTEVGKTNIVEGEKLTLHCIAFGTEPKVYWLVGNTTYNASKDHIVLQEDDRGVENAKLIIDSITLNDYADYTCEARNNATDVTGKPAQVMMTVRVRGIPVGLDALSSSIPFPPR
uniref:Ig-like domain-containing protein n=1 Tax=Anopheles atroparvus TaxID=41427 RepID=A0A182JCC6_ANOAO